MVNPAAPQPTLQGWNLTRTFGQGDTKTTALDDVSISIHVYGADIGSVRRSLYRPDGTVEPRVTGYANRSLPNIWGPPPG